MDGPGRVGAAGAVRDRDRAARPQPVAQPLRGCQVGDGFGVLARTGHGTEVGAAAEGVDQHVIPDGRLVAGQRDGSLVGVDPGDVEQGGDGQSLEPLPAGELVQPDPFGEAVAGVDQRDRGGGTARGQLGGDEAGVARAEYDDAFCHRSVLSITT